MYSLALSLAVFSVLSDPLATRLIYVKAEFEVEGEIFGGSWFSLLALLRGFFFHNLIHGLFCLEQLFRLVLQLLFFPLQVPALPAIQHLGLTYGLFSIWLSLDTSQLNRQLLSLPHLGAKLGSDPSDPRIEEELGPNI